MMRGCQTLFEQAGLGALLSISRDFPHIHWISPLRVAVGPCVGLTHGTRGPSTSGFRPRSDVALPPPNQPQPVTPTKALVPIRPDHLASTNSTALPTFTVR